MTEARDHFYSVCYFSGHKVSPLRPEHFSELLEK